MRLTVWGYPDATVPSVLEVGLGDTLPLTSWMAGPQDSFIPIRHG